MSAQAEVPTEVKVPLAVIGFGAVLFVVVALLWDTQNLRFPIGAGIVAVAVCVGLWTRLRFVRVVTIVVTSLFALAHLLIALSGGAPGWVRAVSGLLTAAYLYTAVLVNTQPARDYLEHK
ncbi:hypothetical protein [Kibdelosporangium phytohabitans]|uniref:Uncharacterized protein n=1 Tax=Kibdelosporangium phytohabitans TaxID=860235 RepID=A0A0N9IC43_9PSEU|nr:hypothetical protein [Kibdelosporangium phytohabitans]ALG12796.1 hypothetical protein AOZ06_43375 [Kibdelosporangium phytohabitans]MBE1464476.1 hypothetical protein [Kibdelosporangium phytohabitans]